MEKNFIIGTAGHIDHGKTSLIKKLTGVNTDRLKDEQSRGITIDLGFAYFDLPNGMRAGIVDVPGHERFIKNMLAGAVGFDYTIFVISAEDGVMPQTIEHLEILKFLGIPKGVIALTKCDLVQDDWLDYVEEEVKTFVSETFLANSPIVRISVVTGEGIDSLIEIISNESSLKDIESKERIIPRLPIDRSFIIQGFGTVVTGTLWGGDISKNDSFMIYPSMHQTRVRSIQVHESASEKAYKGQRVAVNLTSIDKGEVRRGDVLTLNDAMFVTSSIKCLIVASENLKDFILYDQRVRVYHGTSEVIGRVRFFDREELYKGQSCVCEIMLENTICCFVMDRIVIRSYSPMYTIAGGKVIDFEEINENRLKRRKYFRSISKNPLQSKEDIIVGILDARDMFISKKDLIKRTGIVDLEDFIDDERISWICIGDDKFYLSKNHFFSLKTNIISSIKEYLINNPLKQCIKKQELLNKLSMRCTVNQFDEMLKKMNDKVSIEKENISLIGYKIELSQDDRDCIDNIINKIAEAGFDFIKTAELDFRSKNLPLDHYIRYLKESGLLMELEEFYLTTSEIFDNAVTVAEKLSKTNGNITLQDFKNEISASRKNSLMLLELMDRHKITRRVGDCRLYCK